MSTERKKLYWVWHAMRQRCQNPNNKQFKDYGGRGITICAEWSSFETFLRDIGPRPAGMTLDRKDNDKGYFPENIRWATTQEQTSNRRYCVYVDLHGEKITLKEYCRKKNLPYGTLITRVKRGWSVDKAIKTPVVGMRGNPKLTEKEVLEIRASGKLADELAPIYGVCRTVVYDVLNRKSWTWL